MYRASQQRRFSEQDSNLENTGLSSEVGVFCSEHSDAESLQKPAQ